MQIKQFLFIVTISFLIALSWFLFSKSPVSIPTNKKFIKSKVEVINDTSDVAPKNSIASIAPSPRKLLQYYRNNFLKEINDNNDDKAEEYLEKMEKIDANSREYIESKSRLLISNFHIEESENLYPITNCIEIFPDSGLLRRHVQSRTLF